MSEILIGLKKSPNLSFDTFFNITTPRPCSSYLRKLGKFRHAWLSNHTHPKVVSQFLLFFIACLDTKEINMFHRLRLAM